MASVLETFLFGQIAKAKENQGQSENDTVTYVEK